MKKKNGIRQYSYKNALYPSMGDRINCGIHPHKDAYIEIQKRLTFVFTLLILFSTPDMM